MLPLFPHINVDSLLLGLDCGDVLTHGGVIIGHVVQQGCVVYMLLAVESTEQLERFSIHLVSFL